MFSFARSHFLPLPQYPIVYWYGHTSEGGAVIGGAWPKDGIWPPEYSGAFFYADYVYGELYYITEDPSGK